MCRRYGRPATHGYTDGVGFGITAGGAVVEAIGLGLGELINITLRKFAPPPEPNETACDILHPDAGDFGGGATCAWLTGEAGKEILIPFPQTERKLGKSVPD